MAFSIARQPLIPAFLTLTTLTVAAMWQIGDIPPATPAEPETMLLPATALAHVQAAYPAWSHLLTGFMILFAGLCLGRISTRYGLYASNNCLAIPFYGIISCSILPHADYLAAFTASLLLTLATQNFCRSCRNGYAFDPIFRASLYLGLIPFVYPAALPLVLLLPLAGLLFQRTLRELTIATAGVLFPALVVCYLAWGRGCDFTAPLTTLWNLFVSGEPLRTLFTTPLPALGLLAVNILLTLTAIVLFLSNAYTTGSKPRLILTYNIGMFLLTAGLLAAPSATHGVSALLAVPAALVLPVLFVRLHPAITTPVYVILLAAAFFGIFFS